ncbi:hypothetical protein RB653_005494 [Dictyostelium firmibasis]|uniref:Methionine aminopeptidase n=1 Tax=Dictyostelium firmibasis TaxID=79012 RepID=A0AAN7UCQ1_9MYCE
MNKILKNIINTKQLPLQVNNVIKSSIISNGYSLQSSYLYNSMKSFNILQYRNYSTENDFENNLSPKKLKEKILERETEEIRSFVKSQRMTTKTASPLEKMNRKQKRQMTTKLYRNPDNLIRGGMVSPQPLIPINIKKPPYVLGEPVIEFELDDPVEIHTPESIQNMRVVCKMAKEVLDYAGSLVRTGITTDEIDKLVHQEIINRGAYPSPLGYNGFPKSICTSINEVLCHGIPDDRPLEFGDIINIDITLYYNGYHGDTSATYAVGEIDSSAKRLIEASEKALYDAIKQVKDGALFSNIGKTIQLVANKYSLSVPVEFTGHGIGQIFHAPPFVFQCANDFDAVMKEGMIFTIEPILAESTSPYTEWKMWDDNWTISSKEGGWCAQFEHTILVTKDGCEILTK